MSTGVGGGVHPHPQKFWIGENPDKMWRNFGKTCANLRKIAVCAFILQKWQWKWRLFFIYFLEILFSFSCFREIMFQVRINLGRLGCNLSKNDAWTALRPVKCSRFFFWRSLSLDLFRASLRIFGQKFFAPPKICLPLNLWLHQLPWCSKYTTSCNSQL